MAEWYQKTGEQTLSELGVTTDGLSREKAAELLKQHGENVLAEGKKKSALMVFLSQFADLLVIILIIAGFLNKFRESRIVDAAFYGLRAASVALITAALLQVAEIALMNPEVNGATQLSYWPAVILAAVVFVCFSYSPLKKLHPIFFIVFSAVVGIVLGM